MEAAIDFGRVVQAYNAIRDARTAKRHAWEKEDLLLEEDSNVLKRLMLDLLNRNGASSIKTDNGTAYRSLKTKPSVADWSAFYAWIVEDPERFEALEKRVKATFISQYMEENGDALPPGVNCHREYEVAVRRPNAAPDRPNGEE
jgi:hypothetical protein